MGVENQFFISSDTFVALFSVPWTLLPMEGGAVSFAPSPLSTRLQVTILLHKHSEDTYFLVHPVVILIVLTRPVFQVGRSVFGAM
jgi:hypothetical protein